MPIQLNCACGKQLRVPEEHAGKRIKCTACGQIQAVPAARNAVKQPVAVKAAAKPAPAAPARPASPATITSSCEECGRTIKARLEHVGKKVKCPDCGAAVLIADPDEEAVEEVTEKRPAPSRVAAGQPSNSRPKPIVEEEEVSEDEEVAEEEEEEEERPRKQKKGKKGKKEKAGSKTMLWVGIGSGAAVLLGGVVFALVWFLSGPSKKTDVANNKPLEEEVVFTGEKALLASGSAGFVVVQLGELSKTPLGQEFTKKVMADQSPDNPFLLLESGGIKPAEILHVGFAMKEISNATGPSGLLYLTTTNPMDQNKLIEGAHLNADPKTYQGANYYVDTAHGNALWHFATPTMLVIAKDEPLIKDAIDRLAGRQKSTAKILGKAIDQIDTHHVVSAFTLPAELRNGGPQKPPIGMQRPGGAGMQGGPGGKQRPGGPGMEGGPGGMQRPGGPGMQGGPGGMPAAQSPIGKLSELQLGMVTLDVTGNTIAMEATGTFPGEPSAKDALAFLTEQKQNASGFLLLAAPKQVGDAYNNATMTQSGNQVTIKAAIEISTEMLQNAFPERRQEFAPNPTRPNRQNGLGGMNENLKQLGLAFHNYASNRGGLFYSVIKPKLQPFSWRVAILPYLEGGEAVYKQLHLDEPWDSAHNIEVAKTMMPSVYQNPSRPGRPGETYIRTFTGPETIFAKSNLCELKNMTKGTSNTILFVECAKPIFWTQPEEITFSPTMDVTAELYWSRDQTVVVMADGSIKRIQKSIANEQWLNAINQKTPMAGVLD